MNGTPEDLYRTALFAGLRPDPDLTVSEWADRHRWLDSASSPEPGKWRTERTPYLREIMDALSLHHPARRIVVMKGVQIGATECGNNWLGYTIHQAPGPMMIVWPTVELAKRNSKERLAPLIQGTAELAARVSENRSRTSGNTIFEKAFPGGLLVIAGANSAAGLRSTPARNLMLDEVDAYPADVDGEGDPCQLAESRTTNFSLTRKLLHISSPTVRGISRIEKAYLESDQRRYYVPCPECGHMDYLTWQGFRDFVSREDGGHHAIGWEESRPETAYIICGRCLARIPEGRKGEMLERGEWRATAAGDGTTLGYHLSGLYSPLGWLPLGQIADEFLKAKQDPSLLKVWVNHRLGETWEEREAGASGRALEKRRRAYAAEVPAGVGVLVGAVDVQGDRLEAVVKGYGAGEESWLVDYQAFPGDPAREDVWLELDRWLMAPRIHESGRRLRPSCVTVDSGGHHTEQVYRFCSARRARRVYAVRGGNQVNRPVVERPTMRNAYRVRLYTLCTDTAKERIYARLHIAAPGPGHLHFPEWVDDEYLAQLTAEKAVRRRTRNGWVREWVKTRERNEALDLEVYALAALYILRPGVIRTLAARARQLAARPEAGAGGEEGPPPTLEATPVRAPAPRGQARPPRLQGWMNRWKR